ncbi:putative neuroblastoma breakpoint family member 7 [Balaenoptera musculus]|uniref:Neuroblastoma breakpoint family member 7 n=1 Tax=Balaenoptera musculus TaxID=9771 RepID=A0A8B8V2Q9_BALMU|nr:putative neuroblastoma breakpoint family member 7 [Balaenoptera musculus]
MTVLLQQHLKDFLIHDDLDNHQGQGFQERLMEGHRLAEHLAHKLSPGIHEDEEDEQAQETLTPRYHTGMVESHASSDVVWPVHGAPAGLPLLPRGSHTPLHIREDSSFPL